MTVFDTKHQRAAWLIAILGVVLALALFPYASGLLGGPVLYVVFARLHNRLASLLHSRAAAALIVIVIALVMVVLPLAWLVTLLVGQAQNAVTAMMHSNVLQRINSIRIGSFDIGPSLNRAGQELLSLLGGSAFALLGTAARVALNTAFTLFGLYYLLIDPLRAWQGLRPYIPFSDDNVELLKERFEHVTKSTIIGSGLSAVLQGVLISLAFLVTGLADPVFWGAVTAVFAMLPVVGTAMVWIPAAVVLFLQGHVGYGVLMIAWGALAGALVDHVFRPFVAGRYAEIHPLIILVGAVAGVNYLGIIGLLIGPLALSYFFELLRMYQKEYLKAR
ncbi:MAG: AI-2E family transporter [Gemmatimonadales bacterium]